MSRVFTKKDPDGNVDDRKKVRRRIMKDFRLAEISSVDRPMQEGALTLMMKRRQDEMVKRVAMTTAVAGHSHMLQLEAGYTSELAGGQTDGSYMPAASSSYSNYHSHPWIRMEDGSIVIGEALGHTHEVESVSKNNPNPIKDDAMTLEELKKQLEALQALKAAQDAEIEALKKANQSLTKRAELNDAERSFAKGLPDAQREKFTLMSAAERSAEMAKAAESDPVIYKNRHGVEFRKSDGDRIAQLARDNDELYKSQQDTLAKAADAEFGKRAAEEIPMLKGEQGDKVALLRAVATITDPEARKRVTEILKGANSAMRMTSARLGVTPVTKTGEVPGEGADPQAALDLLTKQYQEKHPGTNFAKAQTAVLETPEGQELYARIQPV